MSKGCGLMHINSIMIIDQKLYIDNYNIVRSLYNIYYACMDRLQSSTNLMEGL